MLLNRLLCALGRALLRLRYRIEFHGLDAVRVRGRSGILFLPNHPALVDPIILVSHLHEEFRLRPLANNERTNVPVIGWMARKIGTVLIPDPRDMTREKLKEVARGLDTVGNILKQGGNILLYPAGRLMRSDKEHLGPRSAVSRLLKVAPQTRVVLVRTSGLWGSVFSHGPGRWPSLGAALPKIAATLLAGLVFFAPKRRVVIEFHEPEGLPPHTDREALNAALEGYYNAKPNPLTLTPYFWFSRRSEP